MNNSESKILLYVLGSIVVLFITVAIAADRHVRGYYLGDPEVNTHGFTVMGEIDWDTDDIVFTTDNIDKALEVVARLNAGLESRRQ